MATMLMVEKGTAERIYGAKRNDQVADTAAEAQQWPGVFEFSFLDKAILDELLRLELPEPSVGDDLIDDDGAVVVNGSDIDLVWKQQKVAVSLEADVEYASWTIISDTDKVVESLQKLKEQGVFNE